jgi:hypothetical protein
MAVKADTLMAGFMPYAVSVTVEQECTRERRRDASDRQPAF